MIEDTIGYQLIKVVIVEQCCKGSIDPDQHQFILPRSRAFSMELVD